MFVKNNGIFCFSDIADIPENIKFLKSLQNADFSSNPLTK